MKASLCGENRMHKIDCEIIIAQNLSSVKEKKVNLRNFLAFTTTMWYNWM
jgi:hypothetical protein